MEWYEELPASCPPSDATTPDNKIFYRAVNSSDICDSDFFSQRKEKPHKTFPGIDECVAHAVSLFKKREDLDNKLLRLPNLKGKLVAEVTLLPGDGLVKKTFADSHYSWWRSKNFNFATAKIV